MLVRGYSVEKSTSTEGCSNLISIFFKVDWLTEGDVLCGGGESSEKPEKSAWGDVV